MRKYLIKAIYKSTKSLIVSDLIATNPKIKSIQLDVQKRNIPALSFYRKLGFAVVGEEMQPVGETEEPYFNLSLDL